jgi:hypothetical protein
MIFTYKFCLGLFILVLISCTSCQKDPISLEPKPLPVYENPKDVEQLSGDSIPADAQLVDAGTGSGSLIIDGKSLNLTGNVLIKIRDGSYKVIILKNLTADSGKRIFVKSAGVVRVAEVMSTENLNNVTVSGENLPGEKYGFKFENIAYRAIIMNGKLSGVTLKNISFKNVSNYVIAGERSNGRDLAYKGTMETRTENFKILNCLFDNVGTIAFGGSFNKEISEDSGFFKNVEIAYNIFKNSDAGNLCSFTNVQNYDIHNNVVTDVNPKNNNHNGVFFMEGNGKFHHNRLTNYQGNAIRMWLYSRGTVPQTIEIYNNVCYNTRKYGAFELQAFERNLQVGKTTYANARIFNNTVGRMNTSRDWEGQVLDLYKTGGTLEYYNNLGFDLVSTTTQTLNMINNMSGKAPLVDSRNKYYRTAEEAVNNLQDLKSKVPGVGAM